jgi:hypothetical protein
MQHGIRLEVVKPIAADDASYSCRAAGWWRDASPEPTDSTVWFANPSGRYSDRGRVASVFPGNGTSAEPHVNTDAGTHSFLLHRKIE